MSGFNCPHCHEKIDLFKKGGGERAAREMLVPFVGRVPIDPALVSCGDSGQSLLTNPDHKETSTAFSEIAANWKQLLEGKAEAAGSLKTHVQ
jgi:hypothetical protein